MPNEVTAMSEYSLENVSVPNGFEPKELSVHMKDIRGEAYGRLEVLDVYGVHKEFRRTAWVCRCECGSVTIVDSCKLKSGHTRSCGCLQKESISTHEMSYTPEYRTWKHIKQRCYNPNSTKYESYGGAGVEVCDRWKNSFENFYEDMGDRPSPNHTIDRINPDGDYTPENCRWATFDFSPR